MFSNRSQPGWWPVPCLLGWGSCLRRTFFVAVASQNFLILQLAKLIVIACGFSLVSGAALSQTPPRETDFHDKLLRLGAGPEGGTFWPIAVTVCDEINDLRSDWLIRCEPVSSAGSVFNIHAVANGSLEVGFGQEDLVAEALKSKVLKTAKRLRIVALMHETPIGIMVRKASGIKSIYDIKNGVVNRGNKGSGIYANASAILSALGYEDKDLAGVAFLPNAEFEKAFCEGRVDVIFNALAHPSDLYRKLRACGGEFIEIPPELMIKMSKLNPWLRPMKILARTYDEAQDEVKTLGMRNLLITHSDVDAEAIYRLSTLIDRRFKEMQKSQPLLASMRLVKPEDISSFPVLLHPGALRALSDR